MKLYITYGLETIVKTSIEFPRVCMVSGDKEASIKLAKKLAYEDKWYDEGLIKFNVVEVENETMFLEEQLVLLPTIFEIEHKDLRIKGEPWMLKTSNI